MDDRHIVAIDLGTSKIAITVAIVNGDDIQIIYYKEGKSDGIRSSAVFNPARASKQIKKVIEEAEKELGIKIRRVVVNKPKYEVKVENAEIKLIRQTPDECITSQEITQVKKMAKEEYVLENPELEELFGVVAQSFSTEDEFMLIEDDVEGMIGGILEGNFKVFIGSKKDLKNIDVAFKNIDIEVAEKYFTPESTAKAVLYDEEMDNGVALIDFGAGVTSVSVYKGNVMRHYAAIPFGGQSITDDIKSECNISDSLAENIKLGYGVCIPEKLQNLSEKVIHINSKNPAINSKELQVKYLSEIITARVKEIIDAILWEIEQSGCADDLKSGIVVTGGCADMANCCNLIHEMSGLHVRVGSPRRVFFASGCDDIMSTYTTCSIGMILKAKQDTGIDCAWIQNTEEVFKPDNVGEYFQENDKPKVEDVTEAEEVADGKNEKVEEETKAIEEEPTIVEEEPKTIAEEAPKTAKEEKKEHEDKHHEKKNNESFFGGLFGKLKKGAKNFSGKVNNMYEDMKDEEA